MVPMTEKWLWSQHAKNCWKVLRGEFTSTCTLSNIAQCHDKICNVDPVAKYFRCYIISYKYIKLFIAEENAALMLCYTRCIKIFHTVVSNTRWSWRTLRGEVTSTCCPQQNCTVMADMQSSNVLNVSGVTYYHTNI